MGRLSNRIGLRRTIVAAISVALFATGVAAVFLITGNESAPDHSEQTFAGGTVAVVTFKGGTFTPVSVPLALLSDYYEHGVEHAPPRDPRGIMQQREWFYQPPLEPVALICSKLTTHRSDIFLKRLLEAWKAAWLRGGTLTPTQVGELEKALIESSLNAMTLFRSAQGFQVLDGDALALVFIHAGLAKAQEEYATMRASSLQASELLHAMDQTRAMWRKNDYKGLEARFALARRLNPRLSAQSRRAGYLLADALFSQKRFTQAKELIQTIMDEHRQVGDLGILDHGDVYEMDFEVGYMQFCAGDYLPAIATLKRVQGGGEHDEVADESLITALIETHQLSEAQAVYRDLQSRFPLLPTAKASIAMELEEARQHEQWRQQVSSTAQVSSAAQADLIPSETDHP